MEVKIISPEILNILEADVFFVTEGSNHNTDTKQLQSWDIAQSSATRRGGVSPTGSKIVAWYQIENMGTRETQFAFPKRVYDLKPINGKILQMAYWGSDQFVVLMKQGNSCGRKGLTEVKSDIRVTSTTFRGGELMTTKLMSKTLNREGASEEPNEGNLHVRFCEGAHNNLEAITSSKKGAMSSTRQNIWQIKILRFMKNLHPRNP